MIIRTQRSPLTLLVDRSFTAFGWLGFFYLLAEGIDSLLSPAYAVASSTGGSQLSALVPTINSLLICLAITLFNATALVLWAVYHKKVFQTLANRQAIPHVNQHNESSLFRLEPQQLHDVRDSRITVIHHTDEGDIAHLETNLLKAQVLRPKIVFLNRRIA